MRAYNLDLVAFVSFSVFTCLHPTSAAGACSRLCTVARNTLRYYGGSYVFNACDLHASYLRI